MKIILVADDDSESRALIRDALAHQDYRIVEACDGRETLEGVERERPDLVLLDLKMPRLDGFSVLDRLRAHPRFSNLPVAAVTARVPRSAADTELTKRFDAYLTKPLNTRTLRFQVRELLSRPNPSRPTPAV
ncbi:MAG: response regulator [Acidobacteria bacterium]|nr:response regulator [Acidobacteriota bacterium]